MALSRSKVAAPVAPLEPSPKLLTRIREIDDLIKLNADFLKDVEGMKDAEKARKARNRIDELLDRRLVLMTERDKGKTGVLVE